MEKLTKKKAEQFWKIHFLNDKLNKTPILPNCQVLNDLFYCKLYYSKIEALENGKAFIESLSLVRGQYEGTRENRHILSPSRHWKTGMWQWMHSGQWRIIYSVDCRTLKQSWFVSTWHWIIKDPSFTTIIVAYIIAFGNSVLLALLCKYVLPDTMTSLLSTLHQQRLDFESRKYSKYVCCFKYNYTGSLHNLIFGTGKKSH